jgi:SAM-dependent methyltransferase
MNESLAQIDDYYSRTIRQHGPTPQGVDWNGEAGQVLRFKQLAGLIESPDGFSLNDLGCGYGAFKDYLNSQGLFFDYHGYDISADMLEAARARHPEASNTRFVRAAAPDRIADYGIASGIFNVRLQTSDPDWQQYIQTTLNTLDRTSRRGFAFNALTRYSDVEKQRPDLYYADPLTWFDHCKRHYSPQVALLHDYGLYEFTLIVRKAL